MAFGRLFCFALLVVSLVFTINRQTAAQSAPAPTPAAGQSAGQAVQTDAARPAGTSAAFTDRTAKESAAPAESGAPVAPGFSAAQLRIGGGDLLNISVYGVPELAQDVRVNNSGDVYLPLIGYVQLGGLTPDQAQTVIENRLREGEFVKNPHVTVFLKDYVNQSATVTGEVARPGVYPILGTRRLLEVLAAAGGLTQRAGKTVTITRRDHPEEPVKLDLPADLTKSPKDNIEILPGDTVVVNRAGVVYVVGEVARPAGLVMDNNEKLTVMQAIALAGGPTPVAAMNSAKLIRTTATGREEVSLPLKRMLSAKQADVDLKPDDIIFVPASFGKKAAKRSMDSVLALSQSLAVYRP
ncbi:MAG TPA: polysaccharide biosynthesis/export family protein [Terriglobales bacterium]|nr:polysaccharide biosynthesis/export family protein [Terriglobales bacterium]